eukprot:4554803-Karenia_brevis.AAC.1
MPHCGYKDDEVQMVYDQLDVLLRDARARQRIFIVGGDWNAEVASSTDHPSVGKFANELGNPRGDWMKTWATSQRLVLANTVFSKRWGRRWTHRSAATGRARQIDYVCVDAKYREAIQDAYVYSKLNLGSDHRAVKVMLDIKLFRIKNKKRGRRNVSNQGWKAEDTEVYHMKLNKKVGDLMRTVALDKQAGILKERFGELDNVICNTASLCKAADSAIKATFRLSEDTTSLMAQRRNLGKSEEINGPKRADISKLIQRQIRK